MNKIVVKNDMFASNGILIFIYDCDWKEYVKHLDIKYDCISTVDRTNKGIHEHFYEDNGESQHFVWIDKSKKKKELERYIVHEVGHYTDCVMEEIGITFSDDSDELFRYFQDWYFYEIIKETKVIGCY